MVKTLQLSPRRTMPRVKLMRTMKTVQHAVTTDPTRKDAATNLVTPAGLFTHGR